MSLGFVGFSGPAATGASQHSAFTAVSCAPGAVRQLVAPPAYSVLHSPATCGPQSSGFVPDRGSFRLPFIDVDAVFQNEIANAYQTAQEDASMHYMRVGPPMGGPLLAEAAAASYYNVHPNMRNGEGAFAHPAGPSESSCPQGVMGRYVCAICGDRATGKHYGVVSCEGCKGFFKRTIRKNLQYACREERHCPIDKRQRNRCQFCRFEKCLTTGMKREAVQEERARAKLRVSSLLTTPTSTNLATPGTSSSHESPSTSTVSNTLPATPTPDLRTLLDEFVAESDDEQHAARAVVGWAKRVRSFAELPIDDRIALLRAGWNELLIATLAHRNAAAPDRPRRTNSDANTTANANGDSHMAVDEDKKPDLAELESEETCLSFGGGIRVTRSAAQRAGVGQVFDRVQTEIVEKMRQLAVDRVELELIRAIILFNPDARGVNRVGDVERARERVYAALEQYCRLRHAADDARFAKLLLRLPALRSVGLKCVEHLFFMRLFGEAPPDAAVRELLSLSSSLSSALGATSEADRSLLQAQLA